MTQPNSGPENIRDQAQREGEKLIRALDLTDDERTIVTSLGAGLVPATIDKLIEHIKGELKKNPTKTPLRPRCISAALAYALAISAGFIDQAELDLGPPPSGR